MGSLIFADQVPAEDAVPVRRLREAGAILVGKTTTPEFGHKPLTDSPLFGATRNPWDLSRTRGRLLGRRRRRRRERPGPAGARHRRRRLDSPPRGLLRHRRPQAHARARPARASGRSLLHDVLHRTHGENGGRGRRVLRRDRRFDRAIPTPRPEPPDDPRDLAVRGLRIGWLPRVGNRLVDPDVLRSCEAAVRHLEGQGAHVETVEEDFAAFENTFLVVLPGRPGRARRAAHGGVRRQDRAQPARVGRARRAVVGGGLGERARPAHRRVPPVAGALQRFDFLVSPTLSRPALAVDHDPFEPITIGGETAGSIRGRLVSLSTGRSTSPATRPSRCRAAGPSDGLPIGLQIVGPWYADRRVLALAAHLERERPCARPMPL